MEFSQYGDHSGWVRNLVNNDKDAKKFFESLDGDISVSYQSLRDTIKLLKTEKGIFVTKIATGFPTGDDFVKTGIHSIFFYATKKAIYLYDPNGIYSNDDPLHFYYYVPIHSTEAFCEKLTERIGREVIGPTRRGIQYKLVSENNGHIHDGGYCMFFNYLAIQYLQDGGDFSMLINNPSKVFPPMGNGATDMEAKTREIVLSIKNRLVLRF
jgi:hypothetical protein